MESCFDGCISHFTQVRYLPPHSSLNRTIPSVPQSLRQRHTGIAVVGAQQQVTLQPITEPQIDTAPATTAVIAIATDINKTYTQTPLSLYMRSVYRYRIHHHHHHHLEISSAPITNWI